MFHTKICGVRTVADIDAVAVSGCDAVGINFFPPSIRYVDPASAATSKLAEAARDAGLMLVGLFVNESIDRILHWTARLGLDAIQLHGDEPIEWGDQLMHQTDTSVIRAIKLPVGPLTDDLIHRNVSRWTEIGCSPLLDADAGTAHGGSGKTLDWVAIRQWADSHRDLDWILAGGLTPQNVCRAIEESGAKRVDVASGVERPRGKKSPSLIRQFAENRRNTAG